MVSRKSRLAKQNKTPSKGDRITVLLVLSFVIVGLITFRLFSVQIASGSRYQELAKDQHELYAELIPERGDIILQDSSSPSGIFTLASNKDLSILYAVPREVEDKDEAARQLKDIVNMEEGEIKEKIGDDKEDPYQPIADKLDKGQADRIRDVELAGIRLQSQSVRFYPNKDLAAHILGYYGYNADSKLSGIMGVEQFYEEELSGQRGELMAEKDAQGQWLPLGDRSLVEAQDGDDLILTIDRAVQFKAEEALQETVEKFNAGSGTVIMMKPATGEIIALANFPTYDPNNFSEVEDISYFNNRAIFDRYEPGSTFKVLQVAAGIDTGRISPGTTFHDSGSMTIGKYTVYNYENKSYGDMTVTEIIEKSDNIGMAQIAQTMGPDIISEYLDKFGFRELTGIDLAGESENYIKDTDEWKEIDVVTSGYGQGLTVTPIQLITSVAALANNGKMMRPHLVKGVMHDDGTIEDFEPEFVRQVVDGKTALTMTAIMRSAVENGFAKPGDVEGYEIAGKTGTAQVAAEAKAGYDPNKKIVSFIGFPVDNPEFLM